MDLFVVLILDEQKKLYVFFVFLLKVQTPE